MTARGWCFTSFDLDKTPTWDEKKIKYLIYQLEECPESGNFHFQGFAEFRSPQRRPGACSILGLDSKTHMEVRRGTPQEAAAYCKKDETRCEDGGPWEFGELPNGPGERTDLSTVAKIIKDGGDIAKIAEHVPTAIIRYHRGIEKLLELKNNSKTHRNIRVWLFHGAPGTGKTRLAYEWWPEIYSLAGTRPEWWDGYNNESAVLIDDYSADTAVPYARLLQLLDRYPLRLPVKGGYRQAKFTDVIITSNQWPAEWYKTQANNGKEGIDALSRRIHNIITFPIDDGDVTVTR